MGTRTPLTILLVTRHFGRDGGIGAHVVESADAFLRAGHRVTVAAESAAGTDQSNLHVLPDLGADMVPDSSRHDFLRIVRELKPDVVHLHDIYDIDLAGATREHSPVVWSAHGHIGCTSGEKYFRRPGNECTRHHGPGCIPNLFIRGCAHRLDPRPFAHRYRQATRLLNGLRNADVAVSYSQFCVDQLQNNMVPRIRKVPLFTQMPAAISPQGEENRILFVGRIVPAKGLATLLSAMPSVDGFLDIHGDGWWRPRGMRLAEKLGIHDRVAFHGWTERAELTSAYEQATVVAFPSVWPEPFGLVGIEAMAHGRPVVGSATGGIPEWLRDEETGLLVTAGDAHALAKALRRLIENPDLARRMGNAGAKVAESRFSEEVHLREITDVYLQAQRGWRDDRPHSRVSTA
jgi:glycosyltransferase involved in cell wall biosynthesis